MKHIILAIFTLTLFTYADLSVQQIQNMVKQIHEKREGVKLETLEGTKEPFVRLEEGNNTSTFVIPTEETREAKLTLHAIINSKAFINDRWMSEDDNILAYKLKHIGKRGVVLRNENHIKKLFLHKNKDNFITIEEK